MFKDERIDFELSKIYRNTLIITSLISLAVGVLRFFRYEPFFNELFLYSYTKLYLLPMIYPESLIVIAGLIILTGGLIMSFSKKDERLFFLKNKYYTICFRIFFAVIILSLGLYLNFMVLINDNTSQPIESLTESCYYYFIFTVLVYFTYRLRIKDICINYSYVSIPKKAFYLKTLLNIIKLALLLLIPFLGGIVLYMYCADKLGGYPLTFETNIVEFILVYTAVFLVISVTYLVLSVADKLYYDDYDLKYVANSGLRFLFLTTAFMSVVKSSCSTYTSYYLLNYSGSYLEKGYLAKSLFLTNLNTVLSTLYTFFALACICYVIIIFADSKLIKFTGFAVIFIKLFMLFRSAFHIPYLLVDINKMIKVHSIFIKVDEFVFYALMIAALFFLISISMEIASKKLMLTAVAFYVLYFAANVIITFIYNGLGLIIKSVIYFVLLSATYIVGNIAFFKKKDDISET